MKRRSHCRGLLPGARWAGALVLGHNLLAGQPHTPLNAAASVSELDSAPVAELRDTPTLQGQGKPARIDRHALVTRHNLEWNDPHGQVPLGNGEFCFNADATGLQTFGGNTLSHWAWHSAPLPPGCTPADIPPTGTVETGRIQGPMKTAAARGELDGWMFRNPHPINLGRLRFVRTDGTALSADDLTAVSRRYDLWSGLHTSRFTMQGEPVTVETCVHPVLDLVAVRAVSPLLRDGQLVVTLDFPYPSVNNSSPWVGDWNHHHAHTSELTVHAKARRADIRRTADTATYQVSVGWGEGGVLGKGSDEAARKELTILSARYGNGDSWLDVTKKVAAAGWMHTFRLRGDDSGRLEFVCAFSDRPLNSLPTVAESQRAAAGHWRRFWTTGGAIDLSASKDPRWKELERRIVLSQYQMAAQSAGSWPSAEIGLMGVDFWSGQFHMEMIWWHLAHYGLWDRWPMAERALDCYHKFLPVATQLARQFDYRGAKWGKQVGPDGRTAPWDGSFVLHWQQPHPLFFAELEYRLRPHEGTLTKWKDILFATADYMADFPVRDDQGTFHLQPIMPPSEQGITRDTVFDLAYWRWGLDQAQRWRERLGLNREPRWDEVRRHLAPLPVVDGVFVHSVRTIHDWCAAHGIQVSGHPAGNYEPQPVEVSGDNIKFYEHCDIPLLDSIHYYGHGRDGFKLVTSAAFTYDRPVTAVEIYGNYLDNSVDTAMLYRSAMELYVRGANLMIPHGMWYEPAAMHIPPEISHRNPRFGAALPAYNEFVGRCSLLLQGGRHVADIGMLYPVAALQAAYRFDVPGLQQPNWGKDAPPEADYLAISRRLTGQVRRDFTFLHPEILDDRCRVEGATLRLDNANNWESYRVILLPGGKVMSWSNLKKIKAFHDGGGHANCQSGQLMADARYRAWQFHEGGVKG
jgi:hypothetical protein